MRQGRLARHANPPASTAIRPGMSGGSYKPLRTHEVRDVIETVFRVLEEIGMGDPIPILRERALAQGCRLDAHGRLSFPRSLVEDVIARTPKQIVLHGRDARHDIELGGDRVYTFGGGEAVNMLDPGASEYRPSRLEDIYDAARLVDRMDHIHAFSRLVVATEVEDQLACDINTAYASIAGTTKCVQLSFNDASHVTPVLEMMRLVAGGERKFRERPFCHGGGCAVLSPLRYGADNSEVCVASVAFGGPVWVVVAPQSGATAPAALAGALVQCLAEAIAGLLLVDLVAPGHPVILGPWPFVSDLRTGSFTGGNAEEAIVSAAAAQVINALGLVSSVGAGMSDAKSPDAQAGYEKGIAVALAALAGCNNVSESAGMVGSLMGLSLEALVIDNEMLGQVMRAVRGIEVTEETLSFDVIADAVRGDGHFLRQPQTLELMRSEYHYPLLADRSTPAEWAAAGSPDIRARAREVLARIMANHYPQYIDPDVDTLVRARFPIRLAERDMRAGGERWR